MDVSCRKRERERERERWGCCCDLDGHWTSGPVFSYKLRYIVGFWLVEMAISTNQKPTIYRNLYENTAPVWWPYCVVRCENRQCSTYNVGPAVFQCWANVVDVDQALKQHPMPGKLWGNSLKGGPVFDLNWRLILWMLQETWHHEGCYY